MVAYARENTLAVAARKYFVAESTLRGWMKIQFEDIRERGQTEPKNDEKEEWWWQEANLPKRG